MNVFKDVYTPCPIKSVNKDEFIKSLPNVKLVLGNGFDLHCGLRTKYSDYFLFEHKKYNYLKKLLLDFKKTNSRKFIFDFNNPILQKCNVWDLFFVANEFKNISHRKYWCDIEKLIKSSFEKTDDNSSEEEVISYMFSSIHWGEILRYVSLAPSEVFSQYYEVNFIINYVSQYFDYKQIRR